MVAILLAVLGVPLWLAVGMVQGALYGRPRVQQAPSVFGCKVRLVTGTMGSLKDTWDQAPAYGRWVHDVPPSPRRRPPTSDLATVSTTSMLSGTNRRRRDRRAGS